MIRSCALGKRSTKFSRLAGQQRRTEAERTSNTVRAAFDLHSRSRRKNAVAKPSGLGMVSTRPHCAARARATDAPQGPCTASLHCCVSPRNCWLAAAFLARIVTHAFLAAAVRISFMSCLPCGFNTAEASSLTKSQGRHLNQLTHAYAYHKTEAQPCDIPKRWWERRMLQTAED